MNDRQTKKNKYPLRIGPTGQKILLLLSAGASLSLTRRPDQYFRIIKSAAKEWQKINQRGLHTAISKLYQSQIIDYKENKDGSATLVLAENGKKRILQYNIDNIEIKKPNKWDGFWRIVIFDIPERKKKTRDAFVFKIKSIGMISIQKSVLVCPYDCKNEIDFIIELMGIKPYVRFVVAKDIDIALDLKRKFGMK